MSLWETGSHQYRPWLLPIEWHRRTVENSECSLPHALLRAWSTWWTSFCLGQLMGEWWTGYSDLCLGLEACSSWTCWHGCLPSCVSLHTLSAQQAHAYETGMIKPGRVKYSGRTVPLYNTTCFLLSPAPQPLCPPIAMFLLPSPDRPVPPLPK